MKWRSWRDSGKSETSGKNTCSVLLVLPASHTWNDFHKVFWLYEFLYFKCFGAVLTWYCWTHYKLSCFSKRLHVNKIPWNVTSGILYSFLQILKHITVLFVCLCFTCISTRALCYMVELRGWTWWFEYFLVLVNTTCPCWPIWILQCLFGYTGSSWGSTVILTASLSI